MRTKQKWILQSGEIISHDRFGMPYVVDLSKHYSKIVSEHNALQGVENPTQTLKEVKDALSSIFHAREMWNDGMINDGSFYEEVDSALNNTPFDFLPSNQNSQEAEDEN